MTTLLKQFQESSSLYGSNASYIEDLYEQFLENPAAVTESWRTQFAKIQNPNIHDTPHSPVVERFANLAVTPGRLAKLQVFTEESVKKQSAVARLINHYRVRGHQLARNNPLGNPKQDIHDLKPAYYGLSAADMDTLFYTDLLYGVNKRSLRDIVATLQQIYCGSIGAEFMHIVNTDIRRWFLHRLENDHVEQHFDHESKRALLKQLTAAEGIEHYLHQRFVGQKRFSLEGAEALIPILDNLIQRGGEKQVKEIVIGMAHRGRLNVLINILGKRPAILFDEFQGTQVNNPGVGTGDVKYHMGFSSDIDTLGGATHVTLAFNPSHLEIINPVVEGSVKARQDRRRENRFNAVIPILIHGDAAFAGQGIVMETLNMSETRAFSTGGTIHIIINNQIGFTTSNPADARSTLYCSDVASMIQAPVLHVNGDDPEAVIFVTKLALDFRMMFNKDVVIDLLCYRRLGHNEADEPATTQPMMYKRIREHPTTLKLYADQLIREKVLTDAEVTAMKHHYQARLDAGDVVSERVLSTVSYSYSQPWHIYQDQHWTCAFDGQVDLEHLRFCNDRLLSLPADFELHPRVVKIMESRRQMAAGEVPLDWGFAENLAYATLLMKQFNVRLTGQDVGRGTFFHRHAILHNQLNGKAYVPLKHLSDKQGTAQIYDSLLSEAGVLGFEYGYSTTSPDSLIIWEAQFGDFANGAQVLIDQFISSGGTKWGRLSGLVMLLPHGYEGQGPEHSSARLERYLQLCAEHNIQVCSPTTPAQIFHLLRRQLLRPYRKPLIVMSPKSLLRHKLAVSTLADLTDAQFQTVIGECDPIEPDQVVRLVLCAGKVYYDLLETRRADNINSIAIVRIEQLYPFPLDSFKQIIALYPNLQKVVWCQEEPRNQGAWYQIRHHLTRVFGHSYELAYAGRAPSAAPAVGNFSTHLKQQQAVVTAALYDDQTGEDYAN